jgi:spore germination cell wall hydrolase CwlJ-like protein
MYNVGTSQALGSQPEESPISYKILSYVRGFVAGAGIGAAGLGIFFKNNQKAKAEIEPKSVPEMVDRPSLPIGPISLKLAETPRFEVESVKTPQTPEAEAPDTYKTSDYLPNGQRKQSDVEQSSVDNVEYKSRLRRMDEGQRNVVVAVVLAEAGNQDIEGRQAVINVIINRAFRDTVSPFEVVVKYMQFSCLNPITKKLSPKDRLNSNNYEKFIECQLEAYGKTMSDEVSGLLDRAIKGELKDITGGATDYYNPSLCHAAWAQKPFTIVRSRNSVLLNGFRETIVIGDHRFGRVFNSQKMSIKAWNELVKKASLAKEPAHTMRRAG